MPCRLQPASFHNASPHKQHYPHSQELFHLPLSSAHHHTPHHPQIKLVSSHVFCLVLFCICLCLRGFVPIFCFSEFLFFWWDVRVILVLCIFVGCSFFCEILDSLHFREFLVLVGLLDFLHFREIFVLVGFCFVTVLPAGCDNTSGHDYWRGNFLPQSWARGGNTYYCRAAAPTLFVFVLTATCSMLR